MGEYIKHKWPFRTIIWLETINCHRRGHIITIDRIPKILKIFFRPLKTHFTESAWEHFWSLVYDNYHQQPRHSVCVGIAASVLHDYCAYVIDQRITRDAVHLAGIVHDIGKILFERYANQEFHLADYISHMHNLGDILSPRF